MRLTNKKVYKGPHERGVGYINTGYIFFVYSVSQKHSLANRNWSVSFCKPSAADDLPGVITSASTLAYGRENRGSHGVITVCWAIFWLTTLKETGRRMGKLEEVRIECGFRRISMAISDDKTDRCGGRGKSGGELEAAARRTEIGRAHV